jgi:hypothetical protein
MLDWELLCGESTGLRLNLGHLRELFELDTLSTIASTISSRIDSSLELRDPLQGHYLIERLDHARESSPLLNAILLLTLRAAVAASRPCHYRSSVD